MKRSKTDLTFDVLNVIFTLVITFIILYPLFFIVIASVSDPFQVYYGNVTIVPKGFTWDAYKNVFKYSDVWIGYRNTIFYTVLGTAYNICLTIPAA